MGQLIWLSLSFVWCMETPPASLALCDRNPPATGEFPPQRACNAGFEVFFDVSLNKWLNKTLNSRWFQTWWCLLWRHCNGPWANDDLLSIRSLRINFNEILSKLLAFSFEIYFTARPYLRKARSTASAIFAVGCAVSRDAWRQYATWPWLGKPVCIKGFRPFGRAKCPQSVEWFSL